MKKILVPTDFSKYAEDALNYAIMLSNKILAEVHVVHVIDQPAYETFDTFADGYGGGGIDDIFILKLIESSKEKMKKLEEEYKDDQIKTNVKMASSVQNEILEYALQINADLIVMGTKGTSTIDEEIIGSNTEKIVRGAHCPVLTIKEEGKPEINDLVFASDFKNVNEVVMKNVKFYQETFGAKLHLLRVCTPHNFENTRIIEGEIHQVAEKFGLKNYQIHTYNDFYEEDGIANFTSHYGYDLICLATSGRTGLSHFFTGSIAEDVVNHTYIPVMTFNLKTINS